VRHWSIRARLTVYYAFALALIILAFCAGIYWLIRADLLQQMNAQLSQDLSTVSRAARKEPEEAMEVAEEGLVTLFVLQSQGRVIATAPGWRHEGLQSARPIAPGIVQTPQHRVYYTKQGAAHTRDSRIEITVARDGEPLRHTLRSLGLALLAGLACALGLALAGGYVLAGRVLAPVGAMASTARAITADRLSDRLPVHNPDDELGRLAATFNSTLARLEDSFDRLRRFTSDASHELRTPLAAMKSVGEVALRDEADFAAHREAIGSMLEEVDRLARLVDSLLTLTRADAGTATLSSVPTDLSGLISEVADCLRALADEKQIALSVTEDADVWARVDPVVLKQAVINLLDNAVKYTPQGGQVRVSLAHADGRATIEVTDTGPGIPREDRERVFDRFYRGGKSRSSDSGGVGLGLAIAEWAVQANGGNIELADREGRGCAFRITLPSEKGGGVSSS